MGAVPAGTGTSGGSAFAGWAAPSLGEAEWGSGSDDQQEPIPAYGTSTAPLSPHPLHAAAMVAAAAVLMVCARTSRSGGGGEEGARGRVQLPGDGQPLRSLHPGAVQPRARASAAPFG
jgi:hypothetical protein